MKRMRFVLLSLAVAAAAFAAAGPAKDAAAPPLKIEPLNVEGGPFDVIEKAAGKPCIVFLVQQPDEETGQMAAALEGAYRKLKDKGFLAATVIMGGDELKELVKKACQDNQIQMPVAVTSADSEQLKAWKLGADTKNLMVFIKGGQVSDCLENVSQADKDAVTAAAMKILQ